MNLLDVIDGLVEDRGLDRDSVVDAVCSGVLAAFQKKFPGVDLKIVFNKKTGELEALVNKEVVSSVSDSVRVISLRRARVYSPTAAIGDSLFVPFEHKVGRIEIVVARQAIAAKIRQLEQAVVYNEFKDKEGTIVSGTVYKRERAGFAVKMGDVTALLPNENLVPDEGLRAGVPVRALLKEVLPQSRGDYQLILDRASAEFVERLLEIEIPEIFEGVVEIKRIVRSAGYKTKVIVSSNSADIDPVGTCVGVGGSRIKPILRELGREKIDLIESVPSIEDLVKDSLKPADIDKVSVDGGVATVWLAQDQRSLAIGRLGQNISLASKLVGVDIQLQDVKSPGVDKIFGDVGDAVDDDN